MDTQAQGLHGISKKSFVRYRFYWIDSIYLHLLLLIIIAPFCLSHHPVRMFNGTDGIRHLIYAKLQWFWMSHQLYQGANIFEGMGNVFFGFNFIMSPVFFIQLMLTNHIDVLITYSLYSLLCFLTAYLFARLCNFSKLLSIVASWIFVLATLPFLPIAYLNTEFQFMPQGIDLLFFSILWLYIFRAIGRTKSFYLSLIYGLLILFIPYYLSVIYTFFIVIAVPVLTLSAVYLLCIATRRELFIKLGALITAVIALLILQVPQFLYYMEHYTSFHYFQKEMFQSFLTRYDISLLFQSAIRNTYPYWVILSVLGALFGLKANSQIRKFSILHLLLTGFILAVGLTSYYSSLYFNWRGPSGTYFEMLLWPAYSVFTVYAISKIVNLFYRLITLNSKAQLNFTDLRPIVFVLPVFAVLYCNSGHSEMSFLPNKKYDIQKNYPPQLTPIVSILRSQLAIEPQNSSFKGYEATFTPSISQSKGMSWFDQAGFDNEVIATYSNDHRLNGLWYYNIPILNEYTQLIAPTLYLLSTRLLSRPIDVAFRTVITYSKPNINILRMLGVRFIITNSPQNTFATTADNPFLILRNREWIDDKNGYLYLYELLNANIANYTPTQFIIKNTAGDMIALMQNSAFDFSSTVIVSQPLPKNLVRADKSNMSVENGGVRIKATSSGISTVLLPIQYSHCWQTEFTKKGTYFALLRANLVETLLVFSGDLNVKLNFALGPLHAKCRALDVADMRSLQVQGVMSRFPLIHMQGSH